MEIRAATVEDVRQFYQSDYPPVRMRAFAAIEGDKVLGLAGVYYEGKHAIAFSHLTDEMYKHKKQIVRATRMVMKMITDRRLPVVAICQDQRARRFLEHLGFKYEKEIEHGSLYSWHR